MKDIIESIPKNLASAILTLIGAAIIGLWSFFQPALVQYLLPLQASTIFGFGWILAVLLLLLMLAIAYIIYLRKKIRTKPFYACSVFWDEQFNPLCPSCEKALGNYAFYATRSNKSRPGCKCFNCKTVVRFSDEEKVFMTLEEAKERAKFLFDGNKN